MICGIEELAIGPLDRIAFLFISFWHGLGIGGKTGLGSTACDLPKLGP